jgi:hypothetical protein
MHASGTTILFGAIDRHNLGDLLFAHVVAALLPDVPLVYAGLATRDMRPYGGHTVTAIDELTRELDGPVNLVHVGGEVLTCEAREARAMLDLTGVADIRPAPYVASKTLFRNPGTFVFNSGGGVAFDQATPALRGTVLASLRNADIVTVRDRYTQAALAQHGIAAPLVPDPGVMTAALFGDRIRRRQESGEVANLNRVFPAGFLAVQFSADFADDASLDALAAQCDALAAATGLGMVLFRAGAAPLHDNLDLYRSVQERMRETTHVVLFESLDIWDICALIAASRGYLGSSLHGRIVALAFALPRVTLTPRADTRPTKHRGFIEAWEDSLMPGVVPPEHGAAALLEAMSLAPSRSRRQADRLVEHYREGCGEWCAKLRPAR